MSDALADAVARELGRPVTAARQVGGGDINAAWRLELSDGVVAFAKTRPDAPAGEYGAEAAGLAWLDSAGAAVPEVLAVLDDGPPRALVLRWIDEGRSTAAGEEALGRGLAAAHATGADGFGVRPPGTPGGERAPLRIGPLELPSDPAGDWPTFYAESRLRPLIARAALPDGAARRLDRLCDRIADLAGPPEPPARLHGDLWSGNVLWDANGRPVLIDPAGYGGHREVDLAMLRLFGGPSPRAFAAYDEAHPLAAGYAERVGLWQLFPLLVHAVLFGGGYGASVDRVARGYL